MNIFEKVTGLHNVFTYTSQGSNEVYDASSLVPGVGALGITSSTVLFITADSTDATRYISVRGSLHQLVSGETYICTKGVIYSNISFGGGGGSSDYTALTNKPQINSVELNGNKSLSDLGITKAGIGLGNVDNTSDLAKPISTATQTALDGKQETLVSGTNIKSINGVSILGSGDMTIGGSSIPEDVLTAHITELQDHRIPYIPSTGSWHLICVDGVMSWESTGGDMTFVINENGTQVTYYADSGMTWQEWVNSSYNTDSRYRFQDDLIHCDALGSNVYRSEYGMVHKADLIVSDASYWCGGA